MMKDKKILANLEKNVILTDKKYLLVLKDFIH